MTVKGVAPLTADDITWTSAPTPRRNLLLTPEDEWFSAAREFDREARWFRTALSVALELLQARTQELAIVRRRLRQLQQPPRPTSRTIRVRVGD
jgi:hypothetical protein